MTHLHTTHDTDSSLFVANAAQLWDLMYGPIAHDETNFVCESWRSRRNAAPGKALDIGCGTGRYIIPLQQRGWDVTGVDSSSAMLGVLRSKMQRYGVSAHLIAEPFTELRSTQRFDLALAFFSIIYVESDSDVQAFLCNVHRHLKPHGLLLINFLNAYDFWNPEGWTSSMAKLFKGGHLKVDYTNTPVDYLRGTSKAEDFRRFYHTSHGAVSDLSARPLRFHTPNGMRLFLQQSGFTDVVLFSGFSGTPIGEDGTHAPIITAVATRA